MKNLKKEIQKNEVSILGVSEVGWKRQGETRSGNYTVCYSRGEPAENVLATVVHKSVVRSVVKKIVYNDRIIAIKLQEEPINILMMQVCMLTSEHEDDEVESLYGIIIKILEEDGKGNTITTSYFTLSFPSHGHLINVFKTETNYILYKNNFLAHREYV